MNRWPMNERNERNERKNEALLHEYSFFQHGRHNDTAAAAAPAGATAADFQLLTVNC